MTLISSLVRHAPALAACNRHPTFLRVLVYLELHLHEAIYLDEVARYVGMESSSLSRASSRVLGVTFTRLVHAHKIYRAALEMYRSESSLAKIAADVGFSDHAAFSRTFRNVTGLTPLTFKRLVESLVSRGIYVDKSYFDA